MGMESHRDEGPLSGKSGEAFALLREIFPVEDRATYDGEPDDVERSQWVTNGARRRVAALLATTLTANPSGHSDKCWGRTSYADEVMHCYCPERSATTQPAEQSCDGCDSHGRCTFVGNLCAEQSASSPVEGEVTDAEAERFCELVNWNPDGSEWKSVEGVMHEVKFRDLAKGYLRAALSALTTRSVAVSSRHPLPADLQSSVHDEAVDWITKNCMAIRRDNGDMDYSLGAMIAAYEVGKSLNQARKPEGAEPVAWVSQETLSRVPAANACEAAYLWRFDRGPEYQPLYAHPAHEAGEVERLRAALKTARWYVNDHQEAQPNDETRDALSEIDALLEAQGAQQ